MVEYTEKIREGGSPYTKEPQMYTWIIDRKTCWVYYTGKGITSEMLREEGMRAHPFHYPKANLEQVRDLIRIVFKVDRIEPW